MKKILFLVIVIVMTLVSCVQKKEEVNPMSQSTDCNCAVKKQMSVSLTNNTAGSQTYRFFGGATGLQSVNNGNTMAALPTLTASYVSPLSGHEGSVYVPSVNRIFVSAASGDINVVDGTTGATTFVTSLVSGGNLIYGGNNYVYVMDDGHTNVYAVEINTLAVTTIAITAPCNGLGQMDISGNKLYVPTTAIVVETINTTTNLYLQSVVVGGNKTIVAAGSHFFVAPTGSGAITAVSIASNTISGTINTGLTSGATGYALGYQNGYVFAAPIGGSSSVAVISEATLSLTQTVSAGAAIQGPSKLNVYSGYVLVNTASGVVRISTSDFTITTFGSGSNYSAQYNSYTNSIYVKGPTTGFKVYDASSLSLLYSIGYPMATSTSTEDMFIFGTGPNLYIIRNTGAQIGFFNAPQSDKVTFTANGTQTIAQLNTQVQFNPISACSISISSSDKATLMQSMQKLYANSTGETSGNYVNLLANYTAYQKAGNDTVMVDSQLKGNRIFDGNNYIQGVIPAGQSISFVIEYCEFNSSKLVTQNPGNFGYASPTSPIKKHYSHGAFKW